MTEMVRVQSWWDSGPYGGWNKLGVDAEPSSWNDDPVYEVPRSLYDAYAAATAAEWRARDELERYTTFLDIERHVAATAHRGVQCDPRHNPRHDRNCEMFRCVDCGEGFVISGDVTPPEGLGASILDGVYVDPNPASIAPSRLP